jgi:hypothetical protein
MLEQIGDKTISCAGTQLATWASGLLYSAAVRDEVLRVAVFADHFYMVDQAIHNVLIYTGRIPHLHFLSHESGPVVSVHRAPLEVRRDAFARVVNENGVVAVVHQYDRSEVLSAQYQQQYQWLAPNDRANRK